MNQYRNHFIIIPIVEESRIFMLGMVFLISHFSAIEIITFNEKNYTSLKILSPWNLIQKDSLPPIIFCRVMGVWNFLIMPRSELVYAHFEDFIYNPETVMRIIPPNNIVPNWIETN